MPVLGKFSAPLIYLGGIGALMLCDIVASSSLQIADVALWSLVRAIGGVLGIVCLLGLDQFVLRHPETLCQVRRILLIQVPVAAVVAAFIGRAFSVPIHITIFVAAFSSTAIAVSQFQRSRGNLVAAQLSAQSWKAIFLIGIGYYAWANPALPFEYLIVICAGGALIAVSGAAKSGAPYVQASEHPHIGLLGIYAISVRLMAIAALTSLSLYFEQLVVNALGSDYDAALYFTHAAYFFFASSLINGYLSFLAVPWAKRNEALFMAIMTKWQPLCILLSVFYVAIVQSAAVFAWHILEPEVGAIDSVILAAFSVSSCARTVYTYPSAYWGAFGDRHEYSAVIRLYGLSLLFAAGLFSALWWGAGYSLVHAVALASASNWLLRTLIGLFLVRLSSSKKAISI